MERASTRANASPAGWQRWPADWPPLSASAFPRYMPASGDTHAGHDAESVPPLEQEAFRETCLRNGVAPDGFTVTAVESAVPAGGRSVSVCFGREICQYDGNQTAQWTVHIEDDLRSLVFS